MARGILHVRTRPADPSREDEYNAWYSGTHMPEVLSVPGFVAARRYKLRDASGDGPTYLAIYEIEADDLEAPMAELRARSSDGRMTMSDVMQLDPPPAVAMYELVE